MLILFSLPHHGKILFFCCCSSVLNSQLYNVQHLLYQRLHDICINLATVDLDHSVRSSTRVYLVLVPRAVTKAFYMFVLHVPGVHDRSD